MVVARRKVLDGICVAAGRFAFLHPAFGWTVLRAADTPQDRVKQYVTVEMQRQKIPGLAVGVYRQGKIVQASGHGLANVELNVPVKPEALFQLGSIGKQFAAVGVMMLVEEGKIGLDDSITAYLDRAPAAWKTIRVKNLLSHTSGLAEYEAPARIRTGGPFYLRLDFTESELLERMAALPIESPPGVEWGYRNTNYALIGFVIRKVTGRFYGDFLIERIFRPLGMTATRVLSDADVIPNRSAGYRLEKGELKNQEWVSPTFNSTADGTMYSNVLDLARWEEALTAGKLLTKVGWDRMWTVFPLEDGKPNPAGYGFGWGMGEVNGHRVIEHGGAWQGFTAHMARYPDDGLAVVVLTNLDAAHSRAYNLARDVAGFYNPDLTRKQP